MSHHDTTTAHPDYALMQRVLNEQEASLPDGWEDQAPADRDDAVEQMKAVFGELADPQSLYDTASAASRGVIVGTLPQVMLGLADPGTVFAAMWASAFLAGVRFQQSGGHVSTD